MLRPAVAHRIRYARGCAINSNLIEESRGGGRKYARDILSCSPCFLVDKTQDDLPHPRCCYIYFTNYQIIVFIRYKK